MTTLSKESIHRKLKALSSTFWLMLEAKEESSWTRPTRCSKVRLRKSGTLDLLHFCLRFSPSFTSFTDSDLRLLLLFGPGLYPPFNETLLLANGSTVAWPSRAQLIQIETIEPEQEVWVEGWTDCNSWQDRLNKWYESPEFKAQAEIANPFYQSLSGVLGSRPKTLENAWNLFDYLNVEFIHNNTISQQIGEQNREIARYWANYHEAGSFSDEDPNNVGNIAGQSILPPLLDGMSTIANSSEPLKFTYLAASYKPVSMTSLYQRDCHSRLTSLSTTLSSSVPVALRHDEASGIREQRSRLRFGGSL